MRSVAKKIYISILTSVLVLVTSLATTYAWVGIFTYSETENVNINIESVKNNKADFLTISSSGNVGTFGESVSQSEIQAQIIKNMKIAGENLDDSYVNYDDSNSITAFFNDKVKLLPVSARTNSNNQIIRFDSREYFTTGTEIFANSSKYYKFDLYLSADTTEGIDKNTIINANVALTEIKSALQGTISDYYAVNGNPILKGPIRPEDLEKEDYKLLKTIPNTFSIDSASAARFALEVYKPIEIDKDYKNETPEKTFIYQGGTQLPTLNNGIYSLGGILPEEYNYGVQEENGLHNLNLVMPKDVKDRKELELTANNRFIYTASKYNDSESPEYDPNNYLGTKNGRTTKMKISVYFWFEGWDADCIFAIDENPVTLNLSFTSDIEN